jgi:hypothetical protein
MQDIQPNVEKTFFFKILSRKIVKNEGSFKSFRKSVISSMISGKQNEKLQPLVRPMMKNRRHNRPFDADEKDKPPPKHKNHNVYVV